MSGALTASAGDHSIQDFGLLFATVSLDLPSGPINRPPCQVSSSACDGQTRYHDVTVVCTEIGGALGLAPSVVQSSHTALYSRRGS